MVAEGALPEETRPVHGTHLPTDVLSERGSPELLTAGAMNLVTAQRPRKKQEQGIHII